MNKIKGENVFGRTRECVLFVAVLLVLICVLSATSEMSSGEEHSAKSLSDGWYIISDGKKTETMFPEMLSCEAGEEIVLYNDSLTAADAGKLITTRGAQYGLKIMLGDVVLYEYEEEYFPRNNQMKSKQDCDAKIPEDFTGGTLKLVYQTPVQGKIQFSYVWIGSEEEIFIRHLLDAGMTFAVAFLFVVLAVIALGIAVYLHFCDLNGQPFIDVALFLLICSIWFVTDSSVAQQYFGNASIVCVISFYAFMLLSVPMLHLVKNTGNMRRYRTFDVIIFAFLVNAIVQGILNLFFGVEFIDMLVVTHFLLAGGVGIVTALTVRERRKNPGRDIRWISTAFCTVAASGILALLLYWLFEAPYYGSIFEAGVLIFVILILANVIVSMANSIHYRTELLLYQRMAREDWMTGLGNRQPFEEFLTQLQKADNRYENVALAFLDLNGLKQVNDEFGHSAGDELILGAADCIRRVFGKVGTCYRLGGDEFGVLIPDVKGTAEEWFEKLDLEIERYNQGSRYSLSIARGWSELRREDGTNKTISDWKYEADRNMYEDKGREIRL